MEDNNKQAQHPLTPNDVQKEALKEQLKAGPQYEPKKVEKKEDKAPESETPIADKLNAKVAKENAPKKGKKVEYSATEDEEKGSFQKRVEAILGSSKSDSDKLADLTATVHKKNKK